MCVFALSQPMLFCDNINVEYLAKKLVMHSRTKHVEMDFFTLIEKKTK